MNDEPLTCGNADLTGPSTRLVSGRSSVRPRQAAPGLTSGNAVSGGASTRRPVAIPVAIKLLNWLLVPAAAVAVFVLGSTNDTPQGGYVGSAVQVHDSSVLPTWQPEYAEQFPGCYEPTEGGLAARVLVVQLDGSLRTMSLDKLLDRGDAAPVWKVGHCA